ncbi:GNAT family N-acetyltransferase [Actinoplanes sp. CA-054009]
MIRAYRPQDLEAVYDICARTGASGGDARGMYSSDRLIGDLWAVPYVTAEPQHAYVADDGSGQAVGYIVGTADTPRFVDWYRSEWLPATEGRYPGGDPRDEFPLLLHHHPERMLVPELAGYPAHLHMDLLPQWQRKGLGRALMSAFLDSLRAAGVGQVYLGAAADNEGAYAFYRRLGFHDVPTSQPGVHYMGRDTNPLA